MQKAGIFSKIKTPILIGRFISIITVFTLIHNDANAIIATTCSSLSECNKNIYSGQCCCPTGTVGTFYSCPGEHKLNVLNGMCERDTTSDSDAMGYYNNIYGTCAPSQSTGPCYRITTDTSANSNPDCTCKM